MNIQISPRVCRERGGHPTSAPNSWGEGDARTPQKRQHRNMTCIYYPCIYTCIRLGLLLCIHIRVSGKHTHSLLASGASLMRPRRGVSQASTPTLACICVFNQYRIWLTCQPECWRRVNGNTDT